MSLGLIRGLYDYHRWANRRLFDVAAALGEEACARDMGKHFSVSHAATDVRARVRRPTRTGSAL